MTGEQLVTKVSPFGVAETVARLSKLVAERGLTLFGVIDHSGEAHAVGLELRDTKVVIFGNPKAGTPVMQAAPLAARYGIPDDLAAGLAGIDALTEAVIAS